MSIITQDKISKALDNLAMSTTPEKDVIAQLTSTTKHMVETDKMSTEQIKTLTATNVRLTSNGGDY